MANGVQQSQAALNFFGGFGASQIRAQSVIEQRREEEARIRRAEKAAKKQGLGRLVGGLLGGGLAAATGGGSLAVAALTGAGSFAGQSIATNKIRQKRVDSGTFFRSQGKEQERDFRRSLSVANLAGAAGQDALSSLLLKGVLDKIPKGPLPGAGLANQASNIPIDTSSVLSSVGKTSRLPLSSNSLVDALGTSAGDDDFILRMLLGQGP